MPKIKLKCQKGLTLIELMVAMAISLIVVLTVAILLVDSLKGLNRQYGKLHGSADSSSASLDDAYEARLIFDRIVRKGVGGTGQITDKDGTPIPVEGSPSFKISYYPDLSIPSASCSAIFDWDGTNTLTITYGPTGGQTTMQVQNVADCVFNQLGTPSVSGRVVQMILALRYKGAPTFIVASTAYLNCN
jgi:prepilin-type N-terminal cleavage/methylation domain-containing protein